MIEKEFLEYNKDNILKNLLQAEHHALILKRKGKSYRPEHASCIAKHLAFAEAEAEEAIAHSLVVNPKDTDVYAQIANDAYSIRKDILRTGDPEKLYLSLRKLRKTVEALSAGTDTSKCEACSIKDIKGNKNNPYNNKVEKGGDSNMLQVLDPYAEPLARALNMDPEDFVSIFGTEVINNMLELGEEAFLTEVGETIADAIIALVTLTGTLATTGRNQKECFEIASHFLAKLGKKLTTKLAEIVAGARGLAKALAAGRVEEAAGTVLKQVPAAPELPKLPASAAEVAVESAAEETISSSGIGETSIEVM